MALGPSHPAYDVTLLLNRLSMGLFVLLAGIGKITGGIGNFVEQGFTPMKPDWLPNVVAMPYAYSIPFLEVLLGAAVVVGLFTRLTAAALVVMIGSFTLALAIHNNSLVHGPGPFSANFIYITLLALLAVVGAGSLSVDHAIRKKS